MPTLSGPQLTQLALQAGFPQADAPTASAVALAESGGRTDVISPTGDYGPWQINKRAHAALFQQYIWNDPSGLQNAKMAFAVYRDAGNSFTPWTTFKSGRYKFFLGQTGSANGSGVLGGAAAGGALGVGAQGAAGGPDESQLTAFITAASDATFWTRVGMFLAGVILCIVALHGLLSHSSVYKKAVSSIAKVAI